MLSAERFAVEKSSEPTLELLEINADLSAVADTKEELAAASVDEFWRVDDKVELGAAILLLV